jgi:hypothetical protein
MNSAAVIATIRPLSHVVRQLDKAACTRAIWFDYEGSHRSPPTLLGWRVEGAYHARIVEPAFETCASRYRAKAPTWSTHREAAHALVRLAAEEDRLLVSWSEHDFKILAGELDLPTLEAFRRRYVNALMLVRPWHWRNFGATAPAGASLHYISGLVGVVIPIQFGQRVVADNLRHLREMLQAGASYGELGEERCRWVTVVKHNQWDLKAMSEVMRHVVAGRKPA